MLILKIFLAVLGVIVLIAASIVITLNVIFWAIHKDESGKEY